MVLQYLHHQQLQLHVYNENTVIAFELPDATKSMVVITKTFYLDTISSKHLTAWSWLKMIQQIKKEETLVLRKKIVTQETYLFASSNILCVTSSDVCFFLGGPRICCPLASEQSILKNDSTNYPQGYTANINS